VIWLGLEPARRRREIFYLITICGLALVNLGLGIVILDVARHQSGWMAGFLLFAGALSCGLAGWLIGAWWLRCYWRGAMARQLEMWRGVVEVIVGWSEEVGAPSEAVSRLKRHIDRLVART
jgi:hypothetical protein